MILGACVALLLAGCGPASEPSAPTTPTTPSVVAPTQPPLKPQAPVLPEAAKANTKAGAVAFVRHYVDVLNYAQSTGDVGELRRLGGPTCKSCSQVARLLKGLWERGGYVRGGTWKIRRIPRSFSTSDGTWFVVALVEYSAQSTRMSATAKVRHVEAGTHLTSMALSATSHGWRVIRWSRAY